MAENYLSSKILVLLTLAAVTLEGQTIGWIQKESSTSPSARASAGIAFYAATHSTLLFGGAAVSTVLGDTWIWNGTWVPMSPGRITCPASGSRHCLR